MEKVTKEQVDQALKNLGDAMKAFIELDRMDTEIKIQKQKAHNNLLMAKQAVRDLQIEY